jgi:hypothetical protein
MVSVFTHLFWILYLVLDMTYLDVCKVARTLMFHIRTMSECIRLRTVSNVILRTPFKGIMAAHRPGQYTKRKSSSGMQRSSERTLTILAGSDHGRLFEGTVNVVLMMTGISGAH